MMPEQPVTADGPLRRIYLELKHRELDPLAVVETGLRSVAQAPSALGGCRLDVVSHKYVHRSGSAFPKERRVGIDVTPYETHHEPRLQVRQQANATFSPRNGCTNDSFLRCCHATSTALRVASSIKTARFSCP